MASSTPFSKTGPYREWRKDTFLISMDPDKIPIPKLNRFLGSDDVYWAKALPESEARKMLQTSLTFGLFDTASSNPPPEDFIGLARMVTDHVTFAYLTDVYVERGYQGKGLGKWLVACLKEETDAWPHLRSILLFTSDWDRSVPFYEKLLGAELLNAKDGKGSGAPAVMKAPRQGQNAAILGPRHC